MFACVLLYVRVWTEVLLRVFLFDHLQRALTDAELCIIHLGGWYVRLYDRPEQGGAGIRGAGGGGAANASEGHLGGLSLFESCERFVAL